MKLVRARIKHSLHLNHKGLGLWLVFEKTGKQRLVGEVMLQPLPRTHKIEIGYLFLKTEWGKGYATEATDRLLQHGFETLGLPRICAVVLPRNHRSLKVIDKINMTQSGTHLHEGLKHRYFALEREVYESHKTP